MTVETAIAIAGGFTPRAYRYDAEVSRSQSEVTARQKVPMIAPVRPGDTVNIAELVLSAGPPRGAAGFTVRRRIIRTTDL